VFSSDGFGHYLRTSYEIKYFEGLNLFTADLFPKNSTLFFFVELYAMMVHTDDFLNVSKWMFFLKFYISVV